MLAISILPNYTLNIYIHPLPYMIWNNHKKMRKNVNVDVLSPGITHPTWAKYNLESNVDFSFWHFEKTALPCVFSGLDI